MRQIFKFLNDCSIRSAQPAKQSLLLLFSLTVKEIASGNFAYSATLTAHIPVIDRPQNQDGPKMTLAGQKGHLINANLGGNSRHF